MLIMSSMNNDSLFHLYVFHFSCLITLFRTSKTILEEMVLDIFISFQNLDTVFSNEH